jgi:hypothetical protein|tara:strand:- start:22588 stop:22848 length:261 start_codon:yes stop_codon:yes gene_type:complete
MNLDTLIDLLLQKGFTAVTGAVGLKLIVVDGMIGGADKVEILAIGAFLLAVATVVSYLVWKTRVSVRQQKSTAADVALTDEISVNP